jgi:hypothetical protein
MTKSTVKPQYYDDVLKRLLEALDAVGLGGRGRVKKIADDTQYSSNQVSWFLLGRVPLHRRFLDSVCTKYHINQRWVADGEGEMFITPITGTSHERLQLGERAVGRVGDPDAHLLAAINQELTRMNRKQLAETLTYLVSKNEEDACCARTSQAGED